MSYYLKNKENTLVTLFYVPMGVDSDTLIPPGITTLGRECFKNKTLPTTVVVPDTVQTIQAYAFENVYNTKKLIIPDSVKTIESFAFADMPDLEEVILPEHAICGENLFFNCPKLSVLKQGSQTFNILFYHKYNKLVLTTEKPELHDGEIKVYYGTAVPYIFPSSTLKHWTPRMKYYCVLFQNGVRYIWADERLEFAKKGVQYFASRQSFNSYFHKSYQIDDYITPDDFSLLCGICSEGIKWFYHKIKLPYGTPVPLTQVFDLAYAYFPETFKRIKYGFEHQNEVTDVWDFSVLDWGTKI